MASSARWDEIDDVPGVDEGRSAMSPGDRGKPAAQDTPAGASAGRSSSHGFRFNRAWPATDTSSRVRGSPDTDETPLAVSSKPLPAGKHQVRTGVQVRLRRRGSKTAAQSGAHCLARDIDPKKYAPSDVYRGPQRTFPEGAPHPAGIKYARDQRPEPPEPASVRRPGRGGGI
jgi:hypothetical protein